MTAAVNPISAGEGLTPRSRHKTPANNVCFGFLNVLTKRFASGVRNPFHNICNTRWRAQKKTGVVGDSALRAIAMGKKNQQLAVGLSDPVQAALLKAAARQLRCSKPEENAEGLHPIFTPGLGQVVDCQVKIFINVSTHFLRVTGFHLRPRFCLVPHELLFW